MKTKLNRERQHGLWALSPLAVFFLLYVVTSLCVGDFYKMPVSVAFMAASAWALSLFRHVPFAEKADIFSQGAAHRNIMTMIWIFLMAGAFAHAAKQAGAVDAVVDMTLHFMPAKMLLSGLFVAACLISLSIGTSVGSIVALMPVAVGLAQRLGISVEMMAGLVVGGSFFGDNLSFISDTTVAATRTQGCSMSSKFRANLLIVLPAALIGIAIYTYLGSGLESTDIPAAGGTNWAQAAPYLLVLVLAAMGVNVLLALFAGLAATGLLSLGQGADAFSWLQSLGAGMLGMGELIIVTLLAGGLLGLIRHYGGIDCIVRFFSRFVRGRRSAELGIALMVSLSNFCTANNTVAILTVGDIARQMAQRFGIPPARAASLLDTFSCLVQGVLPYGAQLLMGAQIAGVNALELTPYLYYPVLLGASALGFILIQPSCTSRAQAA